MADFSGNLHCCLYVIKHDRTGFASPDNCRGEQNLAGHSCGNGCDLYEAQCAPRLKVCGGHSSLMLTHLCTTCNRLWTFWFARAQDVQDNSSAPHRVQKSDQKQEGLAYNQAAQKILVAEV